MISRYPLTPGNNAEEAHIFLTTCFQRSNSHVCIIDDYEQVYMRIMPSSLCVSEWKFANFTFLESLMRLYLTITLRLIM